jgi:hypothetical protein
MAKVTVRWARGGAYTGELRRVALVDERRMREVGTWLAVQLQNRTQSGRDEAGNRFRPYSDAYARAKGVPRTAVDLTRTGEMFDAFGVIAVRRNSVRIGFTSGEMQARARYNEGMGRRFLGLDRRWLSEVHRRLRDSISFFKG